MGQKRSCRDLGLGPYVMSSSLYQRIDIRGDVRESVYMMTTEFERRAAIARGAITADFGEGWMTSSARDMVRIAAFAGFDVQALVQRVAMTANPNRMTNAATVDRVMGEMSPLQSEAL